VARVRLERRLGDEHAPPRRVGVEGALRAVVAPLEHAAPRRVPPVVVGVELHALHRAAAGEADDRPVVPRAAPAPRLPAVPHVRRAAGVDQPLRVPVVHVAAPDHRAAVLDRREVHLAPGAEQPRVGDDLAVHAEPRHAAVGEDVEAKVRHAPPAAVDRDRVGGVPLQRDLGEQRLPRRVVAREERRRRRALHRARVEARPLGIVAGEEARVDDHAAHDAREAEPDHGPVVSRRAAAARLPAVHPLPALGVDPLAPLGRTGLHERFLGREELVVRGDHGAAEALAGEVGQVGEVGHASVSKGWTLRPPTYVARTTPESSRPA
jgi:hypothetical protein